MKEHFKPEFVNRLDEILIFRPLSKDQQRRIAKSMMKDVARRLSEKGIAMAVTKSALDFVLDQSFDPVIVLIFSHTYFDIGIRNNQRFHNIIEEIEF